MDTDLPDSILWFIFNKLPLNDHVRTSILSKDWLREWKLSSSTHLNFDLYNTLHCTTLPINPRFLRSLQSKFTSRLDQFMLGYQHATISSIRVNFPLGNKHSDAIDRLISQGIAKGVKHIELLFSDETNFKVVPYSFSFTLLSNTDSLTYLHLENCFLPVPMDFSGLKNLTTLVLQLIVVRPNLLEDLFSNCMHLVDFTLDNCDFYSVERITSPTLFRLKIVCPKSITTINIIAPNLSSFEYSCHGSHSINLEAHRLLQFIYGTKMMIGFVDKSSLKNLTTIVLDGFHQLLEVWFMRFLFEECLKLEDVTLRNCPLPDDMEISSTNLLHLKMINCSSRSYSKISIDAENLSSFEYSGVAEFSVKAPKLSKVFWNAIVRERNRDSLCPIPELHQIENLAELHQIENLAIVTRHSRISKLKFLGRFHKLRQLELFMDVADYPFIEFFSILDVLMASQHLEKFSLTIKQTYWFGSLIQRQPAKFFHNELKYVELHGCVSTPRTMEFARSLLRNVSSLKKITFSSLDKFYVGAGTWTKGSDSFCEFDRNFIYESLKDEVKGQCELIIL